MMSSCLMIEAASVPASHNQCWHLYAICIFRFVCSLGRWHKRFRDAVKYLTYIRYKYVEFTSDQSELSGRWILNEAHAHFWLIWILDLSSIASPLIESLSTHKNPYHFYRTQLNIARFYFIDSNMKFLFCISQSYHNIEQRTRWERCE